jgi:aspartyl-tRNA(Asn)/glutamyl-tRNA(Gln) amidotransferase subunit A
LEYPLLRLSRICGLRLAVTLPGDGPGRPVLEPAGQLTKSCGTGDVSRVGTVPIGEGRSGMTQQRGGWREAQLAGISLDAEDRAAVLAEFVHYDRALPLLDPFARDVPFVDVPARRPPTKSKLKPGSPRATAVKSATQAATDPCALGAAELVSMLRSRTVSSLEVVDAVLARLDLWEGQLNAFVTVMADSARQAARQADDDLAHGRARGALHGVPVTIKDMFTTAGVRTTGGSRILENWVPDEDSALVERLRDAGAIIVGKTNLDEFGHGGTSTLSHFGPVHNPWLVDRMAGGSSGGSAAAVAVGVGPISYGTETGSSVRRPAAHCGVVGFKPTFGVISRHGSFRGAWTLDHVGVFARSVGDAALAVDAVAGPDARDPASALDRPTAYAARLDPSLTGLRVGVLPRFLEEGAEPAVASAFQDAVSVLRDGGAEVRELDVPELSYAGLTSFTTSAAESGATNRAWLLDRPGEYVREVRRRLAAGLGISSDEYLTAQRARWRIRVAVARVYGQVDLLASPTSARVAPALAAGSRANGDRTFETGYDHSNLLRLPSLLGLPGCSVPIGAAPNGLPIGMQIVGPSFGDQRVLDAGAGYLAAAGWAPSWPTLPR